MEKFIQFLTPERVEALKKAVCSYEVQNLMGAQEWDLTEYEEHVLWEVIVFFKAN